MSVFDKNLDSKWSFSALSKLAIVYFDNTKNVGEKDIRTAIESVGFKLNKIVWRGE